MTNGTWTDVNALDFASPNTAVVGATDGNAAANRTALTGTINGLTLAPGATVWIRWNDFNVDRLRRRTVRSTTSRSPRTARCARPTPHRPS